MKIIGLFIFISIYRTATALESVECNRRSYPTGIVCVCNETFCDDLAFENPEESGEILIVSTSEAGLRYKQSHLKFGNPTRFELKDHQKIKIKPLKNRRQIFNNYNADIIVDHNQTFQKIVGFGNAFTGANSHNLNLLTPTLRGHIYRSYYSKISGNGFNILRIPIGGCDFDLAPWAYNEYPENDRFLSNFTKLDPRDLARNEQLRDLARLSGNNDIKYLGAAWSSPKWMKTNNEWTGFSSLLDDYYQTWADYHVRYLELMKEAGVNYWAISSGNEPLNGVVAFLFIKFMSLGWLPRAQGKWIAENLGPAIRGSQKISHVKILVGDDQRYTFPWWFDRMYEAHPESKAYVDGHAVHWYWDKYASSSLLDSTHQKYPEKLIIATEASSGDKPWEEHQPLLGYWPRCEDYIIDIIEDLNHNVNAWIDWNMVLDEKGGPNYVSNHVDAAIIVNATSKDEIYKQPFFYGMGHFSRFFPPDSVRLHSKTSNRNIQVTAFQRPDGFFVVVLYNSATYPINLDLKDSINGLAKLTVPPKSVHSFLYK